MKLSDSSWRRNNLYKIVDKKGNLITFKENPQQKAVNEDTSKSKLILKARQLGISTGRIIDLFDRTIWKRNVTSVIIAHETDSIKKLFRIVYRAYKFMDERLKPKIDRGGGSKYEYFFPEINSRIYCDLESRSDTIHNLHVSEIGLMKNDDKVRATLDAVPIDGNVTYESTPKGVNHFHEMWFDPERKDKRFFFPWYMFPEYKLKVHEKLKYTEEEFDLIKKAKLLYNAEITDNQIAFRRWKITQKGGGVRGTRAFIEEFPEDETSCFLFSGEAVLDLSQINAMLKDAPEPIESNGWMRIYKKFDKSKRYVIGADVAEGVRKDFSVAVVIEIKSKEVVAVIRGQWRPYEFAHKLNDLAQKYRAEGYAPPLLAVERNNHGHAVLLELHEHIRYQNLYVHSDEKIGWRTDSISRSIMINDFVDAVENRHLFLNDKYIFNECLTLVDNDGKIEAADGKHDDCVIATSIAFQLCLNAGNISLYDDIESKILL